MNHEDLKGRRTPKKPRKAPTNSAPKIYCTTYCNHGHRTTDGAPVGHECYVLPAEALRLEIAGDFVGAIRAIEAAKPLRTHTGARK